MALRIIGEHPLAVDAKGQLKSRIGTLFPRTRTLITLPGIHATQRVAYVETLNGERRARGEAELTLEEQWHEWEQSVDLIMENGHILIRPDPVNMPLAFEGDEILQELVSKRLIRFLHVSNPLVRGALRSRGESWRMCALPTSVDAMKQMILNARIRINREALYFYNRDSGTRFLTYSEFGRLGMLPPPALAAQLEEVRDYSARKNRMCNPEVDFVVAQPTFGAADFRGKQFTAMEPEGLLAEYLDLSAKFREAAGAELCQDDPDAPAWRTAMFARLMGPRDEMLTEEALLGLSPEFFLQIEWLPGGRIEEGELIFDSLFDEQEQHPDDAELAALCDERVKGFFFNFIREFGDIDSINIGRVAGSLSRRYDGQGRRDVYIAEVKQREADRPVVRIIRLQKWGIREHLDEEHSLLQAILETEEYTEYILDRRLGCRQLGMNLPPRITPRRISERYLGHNRAYVGQVFWATYFERDYVAGIATDKVPRSRYADPEFARRFAALLGRAAAPNLVVGRMNLRNQVLFDDGDEILIVDADGLPADVQVSDPTGTFMDYEHALTDHAERYARPVIVRLPHVDDPREFTEAYLAAFEQRLAWIQEEYRKRRRAFDTLFKHRRWDPGGSFAYRWHRALQRLDEADAADVARAVRSCIRLPGDEPPAASPPDSAAGLTA